MKPTHQKNKKYKLTENKIVSTEDYNININRNNNIGILEENITSEIKSLTEEEEDLFIKAFKNYKTEYKIDEFKFNILEENNEEKKLRKKGNNTIFMKNTNDTNIVNYKVIHNEEIKKEYDYNIDNLESKKVNKKINENLFILASNQTKDTNKVVYYCRNRRKKEYILIAF